MSAFDPGRQDFDADIASLRQGFVSSMWRGLGWVAMLALPVTLWRATATGWLPLYGAHLALAILGLVLLRVQATMQFHWRVGLLCGLLWLVGLPGLLTFGLSASGVWWLVLSCLVACTLGSVRVGVAVSVATGLALAGAAVGFISGRLQPALPPDVYLRLPSSWIAIILVTGIFAALVLRSFGGYARATTGLLHRIKEQRDEIERLSLHDPLTGLPLARLATDRIQMAVHVARRANRRVAVLYIDLDGFKSVNDGLGHDAGDWVLAEVARRMARAVRSEDTIARVGGDEFLAVIGTLADADDAVLVADKLLQALVAPIVYEGRMATIGASVGIAIYPDHARDVAGLRRRADQAMYRAKREGGNSIAFATPEGDADGDDNDDVDDDGPQAGLVGADAGGGAAVSAQPPSSSRAAIPE
jgi:diguanylate cyclase (GGDEF)-like protein